MKRQEAVRRTTSHVMRRFLTNIVCQVEALRFLLLDYGLCLIRSKCVLMSITIIQLKSLQLSPERIEK